MISKYMLAVNSLNKTEGAVFVKTYIYEDKDDVICYDLDMSMKKLLKTKKISIDKVFINTEFRWYLILFNFSIK